MKSRLWFPLLLSVLTGWISPAWAAPVVSNLTATQRTGTKLVDAACVGAVPTNGPTGCRSHAI